MGEFDLIAALKAPMLAHHPEIQIPNGDDAAVFLPQGALAISCDTLISGRHFLPDCPFEAIGFKALAVNLSDMAAMAATPRYATLSLSLPQAYANLDFIRAFAKGFAALANDHQVALLGGDTTKAAELGITVTIIGQLPMIDGRAVALSRAGAQAGDDIYVSRPLGGAGFILAQRQNALPAGVVPVAVPVVNELDYPQPELELAQRIKGMASSAIDISDGLLADLNHILQASDQGADLDIGSLPLAPMLLANADAQQRAWLEYLALQTGDNYGLCVTAPPKYRAPLEKLKLWRIGVIGAQKGLRLWRDGKAVALPPKLGFSHF